MILFCIFPPLQASSGHHHEKGRVETHQVPRERGPRIGFVQLIEFQTLVLPTVFIIKFKPSLIMIIFL